MLFKDAHNRFTRFMCAPYRVVRTELLWTTPSTSGASSVSLCRRWRRTFWTLLITATRKI